MSESQVSVARRKTTIEQLFKKSILCHNMPLKYVHFWSEDNAHAEINFAGGTCNARFCFCFSQNRDNEYYL